MPAKHVKQHGTRPAKHVKQLGTRPAKHVTQHGTRPAVSIRGHLASQHTQMQQVQAAAAHGQPMQSTWGGVVWVWVGAATSLMRTHCMTSHREAPTGLKYCRNGHKSTTGISRPPIFTLGVIKKYKGYIKTCHLFNFLRPIEVIY